MPQAIMEKYEALPIDMQKQVQELIDTLSKKAKGAVKCVSKYKSPDEVAKCLDELEGILCMEKPLTMKGIHEMRLEERYANYIGL